jgi:molecular chaperone GrpE
MPVAATSHDEEQVMSDPTKRPDEIDRETSQANRPADNQRSDGDASSQSEEIAVLTRERDDYKEQVLRTRAEFANYQKRAKLQADADRAYAVGSLAKDLLDPLDNLSRAIDALRSSGAEGITAGLDMVQKQLLDVLAKHGVEPIDALGQPFDPNLHDAIVQQPATDHPEGTVVGELSKGYKIRDRVLRPTKVAVSSKAASA